MSPFAREKLAATLFRRFDGNPILTPENWPYPINSVFNPAAIKFDGGVMLMNRVEELRGFSHLTCAWSKDGLTDWIIDEVPTMRADHTTNEEKWGLEDPRITHIDGKYYITHTAVSPAGIATALASTDDFKNFRRYGLIFAPALAVLVPASQDADSAEFERVIEEVNQRLPDYARIGNFIMASAPFSITTGEMTVSGSPCRAAIEQHYLAQINHQAEVRNEKIL